MKLRDNVKIVFKNDRAAVPRITLTVTVKQLLENTIEDFHDLLEETMPCTSSGCNNESQNFCDCGSTFEDYEIEEIIPVKI